MYKFLSLLTKAGFGLSAVSALVLILVFQGYLKANIFEKLTQNQTFIALCLSILSSAILLFYSMKLSTRSIKNEQQPKKNISSQNGGISVDNSGIFNSFKVNQPNSKRDKNEK